MRKSLDGLFILKTNVLDIKAYEIVKAYKNLCQVEDAFREIKDFLKLRPIYHYSPQRVKSHVMVCVLAYLIEKILEKSLKRANLSISPREALDYLSGLRLVENRISSQHLFCVTTPSKEHYQILKSVGILKIPKNTPEIAFQKPKILPKHHSYFFSSEQNPICQSRV